MLKSLYDVTKEKDERNGGGVIEHGRRVVVEWGTDSAGKAMVIPNTHARTYLCYNTFLKNHISFGKIAVPVCTQIKTSVPPADTETTDEKCNRVCPFGVNL